MAKQEVDRDERADAKFDEPKRPDGNRKRKPRPRLRVLIVRHAVAEDRAAFARTGEQDGLRPLTPPGRKKMRRAARGLARVLPRLDALATSPLTRAAQTADILAPQYNGIRPHRLAALAPGKPMGTILAWLAEQPPGRTVALVGHEPGLGAFVSWALTGLRESFVPMKKGGACLLEFSEDVKAGRAALLWAIRPAELRAMGSC